MAGWIIPRQRLAMGTTSGNPLPVALPAISHLLHLITFGTTASHEAFSFARGFSSIVKHHHSTITPAMAVVTENCHRSPHQVLDLQD